MIIFPTKKGCGPGASLFLTFMRIRIQFFKNLIRKNRLKKLKNVIIAVP